MSLYDESSPEVVETVFLVTTGEYDEFAVESVWATEDAAREHIRAAGVACGYWSDRVRIIPCVLGQPAPVHHGPDFYYREDA